MRPDDAAARYVRALVLMIAVPWLLIALVNVAIDPQGLLHANAGPHVTAGERSFRNARLSKAFVVERIRPEAIALGTSRVDHGIDVAHPGFADGVRVTYNLGLDGAHVIELLAYLRHARSVAPVRRVVLGLDFASFAPFQKQEAFDPAILAEPDHPRAVARALKAAQLSLQWDTFASSVRSLRGVEAGGWDPSGRRTDDIFERRNRACGGVREVFLAREATGLPRHRGAAAKPAAAVSPRDAVADHAPLAAFRELVRFARDKRIDLRIFMSPTHARDMERTRLQGNWTAFEQWKRDVVRVVEEETSGDGAKPFPVWDFSGYNSVTTERIPERGDVAAEMRFYWELAHFKKIVGDMVLDRLYGYEAASRSIPADFGVVLTSANVDAHIAAVSRAAAAYRARNRDQFADLEDLLRRHGEHVFKPGCESLF